MDMARPHGGGPDDREGQKAFESMAQPFEWIGYFHFYILS